MRSAYTERVAWARLGQYVTVVLLTAGIAFVGDAAGWARATTLLVTAAVLVPAAVLLLVLTEKPRRR
jgi:hypothetical protein